MAHGPWGNAALSHVEDACDSLLLPLVGETWRDYRGPTQSIHGPSLVGIGLRSSAVTLSVDADAVLLRAVNVNDAPSTGTWVMPDEGPWLVTPVRMDQTPIGSARECNASITFTAGPRAVVTHRVQRVQR